ncbi:MAG: GntR family transcriptional regulator [Pyrinomonadaceae bacterium]
MKKELNGRVTGLVQESPLYRAEPHLADSLKTQVAEIVKQQIFAGTLKPGDPLRELHLAKAFNVSQATVREALLQLEQSGLAVRAANRSTKVTMLAPDDARNRLEIRYQLEPNACINASARLTDEDFEYLERLAAEISKDFNSPDYNFYETSQLDFQFHRYIWQKSGSAILCTTLEQVVLPLFAFIGILRQVGVEERRSGDPHKPIIDALREKKSQKITKVVRQHFEQSYNHFIELGSEDLKRLLDDKAETL